MTFGDRFLHRTVCDKAAAYGYHICKDHPFVDGNNRLAFVLTDIFLQRNGWNLTASEEDVYSIMITLARGELTKSALAKWLRQHSAKTPT
jgi:death-on-curing protein